MGPIPASHEDLLDCSATAQVATVGPNGEPQVNPVWFRRDGDHIVFSLTKSRQKYRNLKRNDRVALCISDPTDPFRYLEVRGPVVIEDDADHVSLNALARKYLDLPAYPWHGPGDERVIARMTPESVSLGDLPDEYRQGIPVFGRA